MDIMRDEVYAVKRRIDPTTTKSIGSIAGTRMPQPRNDPQSLAIVALFGMIG
jgi:hypothetical protein